MKMELISASNAIKFKINFEFFFGVFEIKILIKLPLTMQKKENMKKLLIFYLMDQLKQVMKKKSR